MGRGSNKLNLDSLPKKTIGQRKQERLQEERRQRQKEIKEQVEDGTLIIRQATAAERADW